VDHPPCSAEEALIQFLYQSPIGLLQATPDGDITLINPMAAQLLMPLSADGDLGNLFNLLARLAPQLRQQAAAATAAGDVICAQLRLPLLPAAGGSAARTLSLNLQRLDARRLMASISDVTLAVQQEQQHLATQLRSATRTDTLTALPNRTAVLDRLAAALAAGAAAGAFAVLYLNCDRFGSLNDTLGGGAGDELLRLMAGRLTRMLRPGDAVGRAASPACTAARLDGDEFVVVLEGLQDAMDVPAIAQRVIDALARPYAIAGHQVHASVSMGIVIDTARAADAEGLLQDAAIAMREAKRSGGARCCTFEPGMKALAARRGSIESDLRKALIEGGLFVVYQPIIALSDGQCTGVEALVRWRHPLRGTVAPIEFIQIAEEAGLIGALGHLVLSQACAQFAQWQRLLGDAAPRTLSVNVSRAQLADPALAGQVQRALATHGLRPRALQLEVTESLAAQGEAVLARLHELKALGVMLALDDFGTGYSSLACLHQLPVDVIEIDRSFVSQLETSPHHRVLVEATLRVAHSLRLGTVAEGIETPGQAAELARLHCEKGQGYLYARPLAADEATRWMERRWRSPSLAPAG
jgi:diguanylate cyclase (GGDEF)-like protein